MKWSLLGFGGMTELLNIHPAFVHFPIALFPTALFFYIIGMVIKKPAFLLGGRICLYLAFVSTIFAVWTGSDATDSFPHTEEIHEMITTHAYIGMAVFVVSLVMVVWSFFKNREGKALWSIWFLAVLIFVSYLVLQNGDIGGRMVYIQGAAVKAALPVIEKEKALEEHD